MKEQDMTVVANLLNETIQIALYIQDKLSCEERKICKLVDFCKELEDNEYILILKNKVIKFCNTFF